jgi:hypothetical protein
LRLQVSRTGKSRRPTYLRTAFYWALKNSSDKEDIEGEARFPKRDHCLVAPPLTIFSLEPIALGVTALGVTALGVTALGVIALVFFFALRVSGHKS